MNQIDDIQNLWSLCKIGLTAIALLSFKRAIFNSFFMLEYKWRKKFKDQERNKRLSELKWEIENKAEFDIRVARREQLSCAKSLTDEDIESKKQEFESIAKRSFGARAQMYFIDCDACQSFWVSLVALLIFNRPWNLELLVSAFMYSGLVVLMEMRIIGVPNVQRTRTNCPSCGK